MRKIAHTTRKLVHEIEIFDVSAGVFVVNTQCSNAISKPLRQPRLCSDYAFVDSFTKKKENDKILQIQ